MVRQLVLGVLGLCVFAGASLAGDNIITEDRLLFNVIPTTPGYFKLIDGQFTYKFQAVGRENGEYVVDQRFFSKHDWDRGYRHRIVFDGTGRASFDPNMKWSSKSDDLKITSLDRVSTALLAYAEARKQGQQRDAPEGLDAYKKDGMLVSLRDGGCDPLGNAVRISYGKVDAELNRTDELNYDRSLVILSETPLAAPVDGSAEAKCPELVNDFTEHVVKAAAFGCHLYPVENSYILAPRGLPLTILLDDPIDDFCTIIRYRNGAGYERSLTIIYASSHMISGFQRSSGEAPAGLDAPARYRTYLARNKESFDMLSFWSERLSCTIVVRKENP